MQGKLDINNKEKILYTIKLLLNPKQFTSQNLKWLEEGFNQKQNQLKIKKNNLIQ